MEKLLRAGFAALDDELNITDVRNRVTRARFLPRHRALVGAQWMRHEMRSASWLERRGEDDEAEETAVHA